MIMELNVSVAGKLISQHLNEPLKKEVSVKILYANAFMRYVYFECVAIVTLCTDNRLVATLI